MLALAAIYDGVSRTEAARLGGVTAQVVRDWMVRFNAEGPTGLVNRKPPGQPSGLSDAERTAVAAVAAVIESGPIPAVHGVVRCNAWNRLVQQPWTVMSLGLRAWAHRS